MNSDKEGTLNSLHFCDVCKIDFVLDADYALHEFSKKHCVNLLRMARHKPGVNNEKIKNKDVLKEKEQIKINSVSQVGSFAKYGYFIRGEIYKTAEVSKEFNTEYDPYLQKFAGNSFKEKPTPSTSVAKGCQIVLHEQSGSRNFSRKKRKKIKSCQICNITLTTVPEYEAHMKSPQHIWKLKRSGMGVSAHFVKASSDLHTTDISEDSKPTEELKKKLLEDTTVDQISSGSFPLLYCDVCELLLNSSQQYNSHVYGKSHIECAQKKVEVKARKEKLQNPTLNQLYCYSCKIPLNNLFQYNEHKNGKKHKIKCKQLIREGITIPPEERVLGWNIPRYDQRKPVVYPELYEKFLLERKKQAGVELVHNESTSQKLNEFSGGRNISLGIYHCNNCNKTFETVSDLEEHMERNNQNHILGKSSVVSCTITSSFIGCINTGISKMTAQLTEEQTNAVSYKKPDIVFDSVTSDVTPEKELFTLNNSRPVTETKSDGINIDLDSSVSQIRKESSLKENTAVLEPNKETVLTNKNFSNSQIIVVEDDVPLKCNICFQIFQEQLAFDLHLNTENHIKNILELKAKGRSESEILNILFSDRNLIKPDSLGKHFCSICSVTTNNKTEYEQHLNSILHKYTQKDYKQKRAIEVKQIIASNEQNIYFCNLCREGWNSLVEFSQHLHFIKHKSTQRAVKAKKILAKRTLFLKRLKQSLKKSKFSTRRLKAKKNPGVRTKICGIAINLYTGVQEPIPNLESLEPKIDSTKNVQLGISKKLNSQELINDETLKVSKIKKRRTQLNSRRKLIRPMISQQNSNLNELRCKNIVPLIRTPFGNIPPLMSLPPLQSRFQYHRPLQSPNLMPSRNWDPFLSSYQYTAGSFYIRPPPGCDSYPGPPWMQQTGGPRFSSGYR